MLICLNKYTNFHECNLSLVRSFFFLKTSCDVEQVRVGGMPTHCYSIGGEGGRGVTHFSSLQNDIN